ncbi:MAG TPA: hypothetical protein VIF15_03065 [Polyangiaceae bacterium]
MHLRSSAWCAWMVGVGAAGCVPAGSAGPQDAGTSTPATQQSPAVTATTPREVPAAPDLLKTPFEDSFDHPAAAATSAPAPVTSGATSAAATPATPANPAPPATPAVGADPGPDWIATAPGIWRIEGGKLCGEHAKNHGLWLKRTLPVNARIEFDAVSQSADGDLKAEYWGDGRSFATALSYTNATSYLTIFGGWHNKYHVLARINEHGNDRQEITVDPNSDDPREKPVVTGQSYHFKVERADGKSVKWWVDGNEMLTYADAAPLTGVGHDHFGFNDWDVKVCFDNVKVTPLP